MQQTNTKEYEFIHKIILKKEEENTNATETIVRSKKDR